MSGKWKAKRINTILVAFELIMSVYLHLSGKRDTAASRTIPLVSHLRPSCVFHHAVSSFIHHTVASVIHVFMLYNVSEC